MDEDTGTERSRELSQVPQNSRTSLPRLFLKQLSLRCLLPSGSGWPAPRQWVPQIPLGPQPLTAMSSCASHCGAPGRPSSAASATWLARSGTISGRGGDKQKGFFRLVPPHTPNNNASQGTWQLRKLMALRTFLAPEVSLRRGDRGPQRRCLRGRRLIQEGSSWVPHNLRGGDYGA